ncbi:hypothetical protein [Pseudomonas sp. NA-150]|uniref:hypothetical protein n=1 Tax=Pseudomonas sp. NA-150 TaxID=3367525 RepID=UPI0037CBCF73
MSTLTIEGWRKPSDGSKSVPLGEIHFEVGAQEHLRLEAAEEQLNNSDQKEIFIDVDMSTINLVLPVECGPLSDCQFRVYLSSPSGDKRGQFHLVGHRASDDGLIYSNAVMIDQMS